MAFKNYRDESRKGWGTIDGGDLTLEQIQAGSVLRIADATEKMATSFIELEKDRDKWKRRCEEAENRNSEHWRQRTRLERRIASLHGVITRMKNAASQKAEVASV